MNKLRSKLLGQPVVDCIAQCPCGAIVFSTTDLCPECARKEANEKKLKLSKKGKVRK